MLTTLIVCGCPWVAVYRIHHSQQEIKKKIDYIIQYHGIIHKFTNTYMPGRAVWTGYMATEVRANFERKQ